MKNEDIKQHNLAKIKQTAAVLFFEQGIEQTTMNQIAAAASVSKVSLYKHFASKFAIVTDIYEEYLAERGMRYAAYLREQDLSKLSGVEQLRCVLRLFTFVSEDDPMFYSLLVEYNTHLLRYEPNLAKVDALYELIDAHIWPFFLRALEKGREDKSLSYASAPEELFELISGALRGIYMSFFLKHIPDMTKERFGALRGQLALAVEAAIRMLETK